MKRRDFICQSASTLAIAAATKEALPMMGKAGGPRPNLLFLTVDDMNYSIPGFMGGKGDLTPNLDRLAGRSHRFIHNRTTAAICQPSREAMMTGLLPHRSGGLGFNPIHEDTPTLTSILKGHGYFTAAIHKTEHMQPASCFPWDSALPGLDRRPSEYEQGVKSAIEAARAKKAPFFINCNLNDPHRPFYGTPQAAKMDHQNQGEYGIAREITAEEVEVPAFLDDLPEIRRELAQYANSAQRMDRSIGLVLAALAAAPEAANTIVFFSADHGMPFPFSKATVYDSGTRTPALLSFPGMGKPRTFEDRTCNVDYLPTLLDLLGLRAPPGIDGRSWVPILHGPSQTPFREFVVTHINGVSSGAEYPMRAIQDDRYSFILMPWADGKLKFKIESMQGLTYPAMAAAGKSDKLIAERVDQLLSGTPMAFYDLKTDPGQRKNGFDDPEHRSRIARMKNLLLEHMQKTQDPQTENFRRMLRGERAIMDQPVAGKPQSE